MRLMAIDPGPVESAYVIYDTAHEELVEWAKVRNWEMLSGLEMTFAADALVVEMIASYGMPVGAEVFETCVWIGRFEDRWSRYGIQRPHGRLKRKEVVTHLCGTPRGKDANVRQALIDRFGPGKDVAIGRKANPGPLYGLAGDGWAALGVAVTYADLSNSKEQS